MALTARAVAGGARRRRRSCARSRRRCSSAECGRSRATRGSISRSLRSRGRRRRGDRDALSGSPQSGSSRGSRTWSDRPAERFARVRRFSAPVLRGSTRPRAGIRANGDAARLRRSGAHDPRLSDLRRDDAGGVPGARGARRTTYRSAAERPAATFSTIPEARGAPCSGACDNSSTSSTLRTLPRTRRRRRHGARG